MKRVAMMAASALVFIGLAGSVQAARIADNSFFIEEAYNQEAGVVQHINAYLYDFETEDWEYSFTQEWPVASQKHQFSYTITYSGSNGDPEFSEFGDALLNYRYQLIFNDQVALSPRLSLVLPTGSPKNGMGNGVYGWQVNMPLSVCLGDSFVTHYNIGATWLPHATGTADEDADLTSFNYGASLIWLASDNFNLMVESVGFTEEGFGPLGVVERGDSFYVSPGIRFAINFDSGLQVVPGLAAPIGVGPSKDQYGLFAYLSLEHPFMEVAEPAQ